jgi:hypothetical protein
MKYSDKFSINVRRQFAKDYSVPFKMFGDDYFDYFIDEYDHLYNFKDKLDSLDEAINKLGGNEKFFQYRREFPFEVIKGIQGSPYYSDLQNCRILYESRPIDTSKKGIYKSFYADREFISIDLKEANFNAMKNFNKDLVNNKSNYAEFVSDFTDIEYFAKSKKIRQVIYGNCLPKKQQSLQKNVITKIIDLLIDIVKVDKETIIASTSDELIIDVTDYEFCKKDYLFEMVTAIVMNIDGWPIHGEYFSLKNLGKGCFFKVIHSDGDKIQFKNVPASFFPQAYKKLYDKPLNEKDMTFIFENQEAVFKQPYFEG